MEPDEEHDDRRVCSGSRIRCYVRAERNEAREQLRKLGTVPDDPERIVRLLSGGNQQKVVLARWLLRDCRVLLLDEPTRGVDVRTKAELYRIITELASAGLGVLVVSSELEELVGHLLRVLVMREGEIVAEVDGQERDRARAAASRGGAHRCTRSRGGGRMTTSQTDAPPGRSSGFVDRLKRLEFQEYALAIVVVLLFVAGAILEPDTSRPGTTSATCSPRRASSACSPWG